MEKRTLPHVKMIFCCTNQRDPSERTCCANHGGVDFHKKLRDMVKEQRLRGKVRVCRAGCLDRCEFGPNIVVFPDNIWYSGVREEDLESIFEATVASLREPAVP